MGRTFVLFSIFFLVVGGGAEEQTGDTNKKNPTRKVVPMILNRFALIQKMPGFMMAIIQKHWVKEMERAHILDSRNKILKQ